MANYRKVYKYVAGKTTYGFTRLVKKMDEETEKIPEKREILSLVVPHSLKVALRRRARELGYMDGSEFLRAVLRDAVVEQGG